MQGGIVLTTAPPGIAGGNVSSNVPARPVLLAWSEIKLALCFVFSLPPTQLILRIRISSANRGITSNTITPCVMIRCVIYERCAWENLFKLWDHLHMCGTMVKIELVNLRTHFFFFLLWLRSKFGSLSWGHELLRSKTRRGGI